MNKKFLLVAGVLSIVSSNVMADGYTTLKNENLDGIVNSDNLAVAVIRNSFGPDGKVKRDETRDLYIGLKDELKKIVKVEYRKEPGIHHSEVYHEQTVEHIKLYDKSTEVGEPEIASTNIQSYGIDVTTRDEDGSTIGNASIRSAAITVDVKNRPTVRMGEGEFQVTDYGTDSNGKFKITKVKLSKDGLDNGTNKIINVLPGEADTDAVNVKQLKDYVAKNATVDTNTITTVVRGKNTYVKKTTDASGNNNFEVGLNNNLYNLGTATFHSDETGALTGGNSHITGDTMYMSNLDNNHAVNITPRRITISNSEFGPELAELTPSEFHIQKFDDDGHHRTILDHTGVRSTNTNTGASVQFSTVNISAGEQQIHDVAKGIADTDAVNVKQLKDYVAANGGVDTNTITTLTNGDNTTVTGTTDASGNKEFKVAVNKDLTDMNSATFGNGDERNVVDKTGVRTFNGSVNTGITANGMVIENTDTLEQASYTGSGMQASDDNATIRFSTIGIDAGNQIINGVKSGVADTDAVNVKQLKEYMSTNDKDTITTVKAGNNIEVTANGHDYTVSLNKDVVDKIDIATAGVKANADTIKSNTDAIKANTADIADNKAQIDNLVNQIGNNDTKINNMISNIRHEARRGIASASALAALHPLDYNPDHKVDVMGGVGHYRGKTAVALGAAYRPNENLMFTVGTAINGKDSSVNAGVSYKVGAKDSTYKSQASLAKDVEDLKQIVAKLQAELEEARKK